MKPLTKKIITRTLLLLLAIVFATCIYYAEKDGKQMKYKNQQEIDPHPIPGIH